MGDENDSVRGMGMAAEGERASSPSECLQKSALKYCVAEVTPSPLGTEMEARFQIGKQWLEGKKTASSQRPKGIYKMKHFVRGKFPQQYPKREKFLPAFPSNRHGW